MFSFVGDSLLIILYFCFVCCSVAWGYCWWIMCGSATDGLLVADLHRDHELLHRHHVHWHKVLLVGGEVRQCLSG